MVLGVTKGYETKLELVGVGFRAAVQGKALNLTLGFSHPVSYPDSRRHHASRRRARRKSSIKGIDRQKVGQVAAEIRGYPPAGALQGQGRALLRRADHAEGRQEEVSTEQEGTRLRRAAKTRAHIRELARRAPYGAPHAAAHLRAGHRRARRQGHLLPLPRCRKRAAKGLKGTGNVEAAKAVGRRSPSAPRPPASRRWRSTVPGSSITAA